METKSPVQLAAERAVAILGGPVAAARILNVKDHRHQTVQSWLKTGIPAKWCPAVERATKARGEPVLCEELFPAADWAVLREQACDGGVAEEEPRSSEEDQRRVDVGVIDTGMGVEPGRRAGE